MLLYHFNFGYPLLFSAAQIILPTREYELRGERVLYVCDEGCYRVSPQDPVPLRPERVSYHELIPEDEQIGRTSCRIVNPDLGFGVDLSFFQKELPYFTLWESYASGDYAVGFEPGISHVEGIETERERWQVTTLDPYESRSCSLSYRVFEQS